MRRYTFHIADFSIALSILKSPGRFPRHCRGKPRQMTRGPTPVKVQMLTAAPVHTARYSATISVAFGTRGLLLGLPEASACSAISAILPFQSASEMPNPDGVGTDNSLLSASSPVTSFAAATPSPSRSLANPETRADRA